jgi:FAD/FMN-containing dehydrogenase
LIGEITLKVIPIPKNISVAVISFDTIDDAINSVVKTV